MLSVDRRKEVKTQQDEDLFSEVLRELDAKQSRIVVRLEMRKFQKPTTIIQGLKGNKTDLIQIVHELKKKLATGGTVKDDIILLQGDQRDRVKEHLLRLGYSPSQIEVQ